VVVRERQKLLRIGVPLPPGLKAVLLVPELRMPTQKSRKLLPQSLSRADAAERLAAAMLVA
jgi:homoserine kinase